MEEKPTDSVSTRQELEEAPTVQVNDELKKISKI